MAAGLPTVLDLGFQCRSGQKLESDERWRIAPVHHLNHMWTRSQRRCLRLTRQKRYVAGRRARAWYLEGHLYAWVVPSPASMNDGLVTATEFLTQLIRPMLSDVVRDDVPRP